VCWARAQSFLEAPRAEPRLAMKVDRKLENAPVRCFVSSAEWSRQRNGNTLAQRARHDRPPTSPAAATRARRYRVIESSRISVVTETAKSASAQSNCACWRAWSTTRSLVGSVFLAFGFAAAPSIHAAASTTDAPVLEEILVTATRRQTTLEDTPVAVSAFSGAAMDRLNLSRPMDYEAIVPSMTIQDDPNRISIRGVGRFSNALGVSPGVPTYYDGVYGAEDTALGALPINTESVQILRGPQGTLFGRNTTGGAVVVTTKRPSDEADFEMRARAGNYNARQYSAVVSGPLFGEVRGRLIGARTTQAALQQNRSGSDVGDIHWSYLEGQVDWTVGNLYLWFKAGHLESNYRPGAATWLGPYDDINVARSALFNSPSYLQAQNGVSSSTNPTKVDLSDPGRARLQHHQLYTWEGDYRFDTFEVKLLGNYNTYNASQRNDPDNTANQDIRIIEQGAQDETIWSQEVQLTSTPAGRLKWVAGLYFLDDQNWQLYTLKDFDRPSLQTVLNPPYLPSATFNPGGTVANPNEWYYSQVGELQTRSYAAYGEATYTFSASWALTLGLRYSYDSFHGEESQVIYGDSTVFTPPDTALAICAFYSIPDALCTPEAAYNFSKSQTSDTHDFDEDHVSGRIIVEYTPTDVQLIWLTIANGFKTGGVLLGALQGIDTPEPHAHFQPEEVLMLEGGWRSTPGGTLELEAIAFWYDYHNMQQSTPYQNAQGIRLDNVSNIDTEMYGVELGGRYVWNRLSLWGNYSYNHTEFTDDFYGIDTVFCACAQNVEGNEMVMTPKHKFAIGGDWTWSTGVGTFSIGGTYAYVGQRYNDIYNSEPIQGDSYARLDLSANWTHPNGRLTVEIAGKNVTDAQWYNTRGAGRAAVPPGIAPIIQRGGDPADPRLYWVELQYRLQ
jgi:iron complex outermembrane receptor protein